MNCEQVQNLLGHFHDGELSRAEQAVIGEHLQGCPSCAMDLAAITELGECLQTLSEPEPPGDLWNRIAQQLVTAEPRPAVADRKVLHYWRAALVAALVVLAVTTGWLAHRPTSPSDDPTVPVVDLGRFLGPEMAVVPAQGQRMSPEETARRVSFRILTTPKLPEGYSLEESYLVRIEGCNVVQYKYLRGSDVALLLQYSQGQPVSFGNRPVVALQQINGKPVQIVQGDGHLAASWKANGTAVSLVGPRNQSELVRLVAYVDQQLTEGQK